MPKGFDPADYPGAGLFFASDESLAKGFQRCYQNGMQELHVPEDVFEELVKKGVIVQDPFYAAGESWHVAPDGLPAFSNALKQGTPGIYHPEGE